MRTIEGFENYVASIEHTIGHKFIPTIFGQIAEFSADFRKLFSLPVRDGGLGIKTLADESRVQFEGSKTITKLNVNAILDQSNNLPEYDEQGNTFKQLKHSVQITERLK